jgi:hypothetical protein
MGVGRGPAWLKNESVFQNLWSVEGRNVRKNI